MAKNNVYIVRTGANTFDVYGTGKGNLDRGERQGLFIKDLGDAGFLYEHFMVPAEFRYSNLAARRVTLDVLSPAARDFVRKDFNL